MALLEREPPLEVLDAALADAAAGEGRVALRRPPPEAVRRVADRNKLPVDRITEVRVLNPYFYRHRC